MAGYLFLNMAWLICVSLMQLSWYCLWITLASLTNWLQKQTSHFLIVSSKVCERSIMSQGLGSSCLGYQVLRDHSSCMRDHYMLTCRGQLGFPIGAGMLGLPSRFSAHAACICRLPITHTIPPPACIYRLPTSNTMCLYTYSHDLYHTKHRFSRQPHFTLSANVPASARSRVSHGPEKRWDLKNLR